MILCEFQGGVLKSNGRLPYVFLTLLVTSLNWPWTMAHAACSFGPDGIAVCDQSGSANLEQKSREASEKLMEAAAAAGASSADYCQKNPTAADCLGGSQNSTWTLTCPPGEISSGGPQTSATCILDPNARAGSLEAEGPKKATQPPVPSPRPDPKKSTTGSDTQDHLVSSDAERWASQCRDEAASAMSACRSSLDGVQSLRDRVSQASASMQGQSTAGACGQMANTAGGASSQMQGYRSRCQSAVSACSSSCSTATGQLRNTPSSGAYVRATKGQAQCESGSSMIASMDVNISQARSVEGRARRCYSDITGTSLPSANEDPTQAFQVPNPAQDCSNPSFARTNQVCICQVNPSACGPNTSSVTTDAMGGPAYKETSREDLRAQAAAAALPILDDAMGGAGYNANHQASRHGQTPQQPGSLASLGGATSGGAAADNRRNNRNLKGGRYNTEVYAGRLGGVASANNPANSGGYPNDAKNKRNGAFAGKSKGSIAKTTGVDLRRFLPKIDPRHHINRGPAQGFESLGMRHTNIFVTIKNRYVRVFDPSIPQ